MRKSKEETAETRRHIIDTAAKEFRLNGIQATGLAALMSKAGLTHGGFYRHFESKEQLVAEACAAGMTHIVDVFENTARRCSDEGGYQAMVERYVSTAHRDNASGGCPLAGLGSELARADSDTRAAASRGFNELVDVMTAHIRAESDAQARSRAVFALAAMIGAVTVSRIIEDEQASTAVLDDVKRHLDAM
ncbi:TetR/AcrR family transcriptional regulator [Herbaspirillum robiniae]|uniref:TetR/AcrR family transcriptional regulator n=1 Tax=Herbaspirillum robiniae TaxID=2014887 RepID=UPI003D786AE8